MDEEKRYLVWNDTLRTKLADKTQENLNLQRVITEQEKLIKQLKEKK